MKVPFLMLLLAATSPALAQKKDEGNAQANDCPASCAKTCPVSTILNTSSKNHPFSNCLENIVLKIVEGFFGRIVEQFSV